MQSLPAALLPLGAWPQFVTWWAIPDPNKPGKLKKFPSDWQTGAVVSAHDPQYWTSAACALAIAPTFDRGHGSGAGFVFTKNDPYFFLDIDRAWDPVAQAWSPLAVDMCARLAGAAVEVSVSGTGLHIIGRAADMPHGCRNDRLGLELYTADRFVALTGINAQGDANADCTAGLASIIAEFFPLTVTGPKADWTTEPVEGYTGPPDDDALIAKAMASSQRSAAGAFGGDVTFADLWEARADALGAKWPPDKQGSAYNGSQADMALANMLAFWTGKNCERMERLMRRSALARDKWDTHRTYLEDTIKQACAFIQSVYNSVPTPPPAPVMAPVSQEVLQAAASATGRKLRDASREFMGPHEQLGFFDGCFYDNASEKVYHVGRNTVFSKSAFDVNFGGHMFILDHASQKTTTSAWEAFTQSRVNVPQIVDALVFRPENEPGELISDGKRIYVNSYVPYVPKVVDGDPGKFLGHIARMLPDERDRKILLSYMASLCQNPGRKFQWWPVIQGAEGNGKTLLISALSYVMGQEYTHLPDTQKLVKNGSNFNSWIYRKLFIGMEEIYVPKRREFLEEFKVVVTNERLEIEGKGVNQFMGDNRVNGMLCTNHEDGVPVTFDTRRYAVFFTAQQDGEDWQTRDGMDVRYFSDLLDWTKGRGAYREFGPNYGFAVIAKYLLDYKLEAEFDPAQLSIRAPKTTSTGLAVKASYGRAEQEILDAIEEGRPGFAGGWVSSKYMDHLLEQIKVPVPRNKRRQLMRVLGYSYHPGLIDGRVNDTVTPDNGKPRLYVRDGHISLNIKSPSDIARAYAKAQEPGQANHPSAAVLAFGAKPS